VNGCRPVVLYTDAPWALGDRGTAESERATIERDIFGEDVELRLNRASAGRYDFEGPEFEKRLRGVEGLAIYRMEITSELLDAIGSSLRVVARQGVGFENAHPELLYERGIVGFHIPDYCVHEVVTHTTALALVLERGVIQQHQRLVEGAFDTYWGGIPRRLQDRTAGIIGFGRIGRAMSVRLRLFYGTVQAYDPYVDADMMATYGVRAVGFRQLLESSDMVLVHCPLTDETRCMIDEDALAVMRDSAFLVNTARGAVIDSRALYHALSMRSIAGAALDVFTPEDPTGDPWYSKVLGLDNVVVTSHRAFLSREAEESARRRVAVGIHQVLTTGVPPAVGLLTGRGCA
jgi:phosphoglycerate dehydrogenase-like enzyme